MKCLKIIALMFGTLTTITSGSLYASEAINIVPKPVSVITLNGNFTLTGKTQLLYNFQGKDVENITGSLTSHLKKFYGLEGLSQSFSAKPGKNSIFISLNPKADIKKEGYKLTVKKGGI